MKRGARKMSRAAPWTATAYHPPLGSAGQTRQSKAQATEERSAGYRRTTPESKGCTTKLCAPIRVAVHWQCNSNVNNEFLQLQRACSDARRQCAEKTTVPARTTLHEYRDRRSGKDAEAEKWRSEKFQEVVHSPLMQWQAQRPPLPPP